MVGGGAFIDMRHSFGGRQCSATLIDNFGFQNVVHLGQENGGCWVDNATLNPGIFF